MKLVTYKVVRYGPTWDLVEWLTDNIQGVEHGGHFVTLGIEDTMDPHVLPDMVSSLSGGNVVMELVSKAKVTKQETKEEIIDLVVVPPDFQDDPRR